MVRFCPVEIDIGQVLADQSDAGEIVGLIAGRRDKLCGRNPRCIQDLPPHFGPGQVCAAVSVALKKSRIGEVLSGEIWPERLLPSKAMPVNRGS